MEEMVQNRIEALKSEYAEGQKKLMELKSKENDISNTLMRIQGAIQVLHEPLFDDDVHATNAVPPEQSKDQHKSKAKSKT